MRRILILISVVFCITYTADLVGAVRPIGMWEYVNFIETLESCGIDDDEYKRAIGALYDRIWGKTSDELRSQFAVPSGDMIVNYLPDGWLSELAEWENAFVETVNIDTARCHNLGSAVDLMWEIDVFPDEPDEEDEPEPEPFIP